MTVKRDWKAKLEYFPKASKAFASRAMIVAQRAAIAVAGTASLFAMVSAPAAQAQVAPVINCQGRPVTSLVFNSPTLESGTNLQVGAIYRFSNIATGIDGLVQITGFANGGSLSIIDRDTGLINNFQPELNSSASGTGAADFNIRFVLTGTNVPAELDIAVGSIDVDGNNTNLREYVEYQDTSSGYVLNSTTQLDRNASGPTAGRNRYESRTVTVAPGIDPTAQDNIVIVFYTDTSTFDFRIGALGTGNMTRLTSQGYDCPNLSSPITTAEINEDFGDAPTTNYGNPIHTIVSGIQLGATNTFETASGNSPTANTDVGDDGVTIPTLTAGVSGSIQVQVSGAGGLLQSWIDWNDDGDILDAGEQIALNVADSDNDGLITLNVTPPLSAANGTTIGRFRWSTATNVGYQEPAEDGEVEDYLITVNQPAILTAVKTIAVYDPTNVGLYALPGNDVVYTITATNTGDGPADSGSIELIDNLPPEIEIWNDDIDDGGPETDPVSFSQTGGAGLTFNYATDVRFGTGATAPADFASCTTIAPDGNYRPDFTYICFNPKGSMAAGNPDPTFSLSFRARIE